MHITVDLIIPLVVGDVLICAAVISFPYNRNAEILLCQIRVTSQCFTFIFHFPLSIVTFPLAIFNSRVPNKNIFI